MSLSSTNPLQMRSERLMVIGSSMLGTTWTTITFASSTRDLEDWLTLSTYKPIRQNSINIVPYSGPTPGDPKMVLLRNRLRLGSRIRTMTTNGSSPSGGSSFPTLPSTSTLGVYQLTSTCRYGEDLTGPSFTGSNIHWTNQSSSKETRSGSTNKSTMRT